MATITIGRKLSYLTDSVTTAQGPAGGQSWLVAEQNSLVPTPKDFMELAYGNSDFPDSVTQVVYKIGGPAGIVVATVQLSYDAEGNIATVRRI